jgi:hypothetical protein
MPADSGAKVATWTNAKVTIVRDNVFLADGKAGIKVHTNIKTKAFDQGGKAVPIEQVLQHNAQVDATLRGSFVEEIRPAKQP